MNKIKFGTDGWRGIMADDFTFANLRQVSQAVAQYVVREGGRERGVVVGRDNRFLAEQFARSVAEVLIANGIKVDFIGAAVPTPVLAHAVVARGAFGALMLTASHNPAEYNGIKFIPAYGGPATPEITAAIERELQAVRLVDYAPVADEALAIVDPRPAYFARLRQVLAVEAMAKRPFKVVVDPLYGAGSGYLEEFLAGLGYQVVATHNRRDPLFGGHLPDPSGEVLQDTAALVRAEGAQLGLALDGDADRFGVIDAAGDFVPANRVLALVYQHLIAGRGLQGPVARSVATTHLLDKIAAANGFTVLETPVGFKYIGRCLREKDALLGGEESGGLSIRGHLPEKDGILACLLVVEAVAVAGKSLAALSDELTRVYGPVYNRRWDVRVAPEVKERILAMLASYMPAKLAGEPVVERLNVDGVKLGLAGGGWVLIRPSGTEPLLRIYAEAGSESRAEAVVGEVRRELGM